MLILFSCGKEADDDNSISYSFINHTWKVERQDFDIVVYNNILNINIHGENAKGTNSNFSLSIVDPIVGIFNVDSTTKHAFTYDHTVLSNDPLVFNHVVFSNQGRKSFVEVTKLDYLNKIISFRFETVLDGGDTKGNALVMMAENMPMSVVPMNANYAKYKIMGVYSLAVDTLPYNVDGKYYQAAALGGPRVYCASQDKISRSIYTQTDTSLEFFAGYQIPTHQSMLEYKLDLYDVAPNGVKGKFDAKVIFTDYPNETPSVIKEGYFEAYSN